MGKNTPDWKIRVATLGKYDNNLYHYRCGAAWKDGEGPRAKIAMPYPALAGNAAVFMVPFSETAELHDDVLRRVVRGKFSAHALNLAYRIYSCAPGKSTGERWYENHGFIFQYTKTNLHLLDIATWPTAQTNAVVYMTSVLEQEDNTGALYCEDEGIEALV